MEGFTIVDGGVAIVIILSAVLAYSRGLVRETLSIGSWIISAIAAYILAPEVEPFVRELPIVRDFVDGQCELSLGLSFLLVGVVGLVIMSVFTPLFSGIVQRSILGGIDQAVGFLFGALRGVLLVSVALFIYNWAVTDQSYAAIDDSRSAEVFGRLAAKIEAQLPEDVPAWFETRMEAFTAECRATEEG